MKKEGAGNPRNPDISFGADVKMRELRFEKAPESEVRFHGNTGRDSVSVTGRENLPDEVSEGVVYNNAGIQLRIASQIANSNSNFEINSDKGRVRTSWKDLGQKTGEKQLESGEEQEDK